MSKEWSAWWRRCGLYIAVLSWLPLVPLVAFCFAAYRDVQDSRNVAFQAEMSQLRTRAIRRATQLEMAIESVETPQLWELLRNDPRVMRTWLKSNAVDDHRLYAAVVDPSGEIVLHTSMEVVGQSIGSEWYDFVVRNAGAGIVKLVSSTLSEGRSAYDLRVPVVGNGKVLGDYHEGLDANTLDAKLAQVERDTLMSWLIPLLLALGLAAAAYLALLQLALAVERCHQQSVKARLEHARELGQIAGGLAHEIRNPLHALRMNLHVLGKSFSGRAQLNAEDLAATLSGSSTEIERLDQIIRELLRYALPEEGKPEDVNLASELQATLNLMQEDLKQQQIEVRIPESQPTTLVSIDPVRLRQLLVNLLTFAQSNAGPKGRIDVALTQTNAYCEIDITDSGPTLPESQRLHIFEPFQATKEIGSGLGLALVKSYVERAGGTAVCIEHPPRGNSFRVRLPRLSSPH